MLTAAGLLDLWERGAHASPAERGRLLACAALPNLRVDDVGGLTLGQRNRALFDLRSLVFGPVLEAAVRCPSCTTAVEFSLEANDFVEQAGTDSAVAWQQMNVDDFHITFRPMTTEDLSAAGRTGRADLARRELVGRAIGAVRRSDESIAFQDVPPHVFDAIGDAIIDMDPGVEAVIGLDCPACAHAWSLPLDIASFLWSEVVSESERLLFEIHTLARAYGWREGDVLALSSVRRKAYLDMAT